MKSFLTSLKRQDGFTLVELMVVVAIIGLLSAVAVPNFKKYQAKAKISEAKLQLSAIYTAEAAFFSDYNMYGVCLTYMGFDPAPEARNRYYAVGFGNTALTAIAPNAHQAAVNSGLNAADCPAAAAMVPGAAAGANSTNPASWFAAGKGIGAIIATTMDYIDGTSNGDQGSAAAMTFTAAAGGVISQNFTAQDTASSLTINQAKVLSIVRNGF